MHTDIGSNTAFRRRSQTGAVRRARQILRLCAEFGLILPAEQQKKHPRSAWRQTELPAYILTGTYHC